MLKIVITGPESSGKTTLVDELSTRLNVEVVPEIARDYLHNRGGTYSEEDLLKIAELQALREDEVIKTKPDILLCDTDLLTICIWAQDKFGRCDDLILKMLAERPVDLYLLCQPDIPWEADPLRENPNDRDRIFGMYIDALQNKTYSLIRGSRKNRLKDAINAIERLRDSVES